MTDGIIIRVVDVKLAAGGAKVVYYVEDRQVQCTWEGTPPSVGDVFVIDPRHPGRNAQKLGGPEVESWTADNDALRWRKPVTPTSKISRMEVLRQRHTVRHAVRDYLDGQGFIEIDVPLLVHGASPDIAIDSFKVEDRYLVSSAEYQLKRLAVGGFSKPYSLTKNFRRGDASRVRNPEFTMLEWGRVGCSMREIENDAEYMVADALDALELQPVVSYQGNKIDLKAPWDRIPVLEAIERVTGVAMRNFDAESCRKAAVAAGLEVRNEWAENKAFLFSLLMDHIQPKLGDEKPVFLTEWPMFQTTSASADPSDPTLARRSE
jgi:elongation factor P--(R)-beta-lysine ligase